MVAALLLLFLHTPAQDTSLQEQISTLQQEWKAEWRASDSLRIAAILKRMRADSLQRVVRTDSLLRVARADSLLRIARADSLLRVARVDSLQLVVGTDSLQGKGFAGRSNQHAEPDAEILSSLQLQIAARSALRAWDSLPPRQGQTISDTVTLELLRLEADTGIASFYADAFHGKRTSSGLPYDMHDLTCAHRWLPFGTKLHVTNLANGKEVEVVVTDRGPFKHGRLLDLSKGAALALDMVSSGTALVAIRVTETEP